VFEVLDHVKDFFAKLEVSLGDLPFGQVFLLSDEVVDLQANHLELVNGGVFYCLFLKISKEVLRHPQAVK